MEHFNRNKKLYISQFCVKVLVFIMIYVVSLKRQKLYEKNIKASYYDINIHINALKYDKLQQI